MQHMQKWSLQNAIRRTCNQFLDKSNTKSQWSVMLDPLIQHYHYLHYKIELNMQAMIA